MTRLYTSFRRTPSGRCKGCHGTRRVQQRVWVGRLLLPSIAWHNYGHIRRLHVRYYIFCIPCNVVSRSKNQQKTVAISEIHWRHHRHLNWQPTRTKLGRFQNRNDVIHNFGILEWEFEEPSKKVNFLNLTISIKNKEISTEPFSESHESIPVHTLAPGPPTHLTWLKALSTAY